MKRRLLDRFVLVEVKNLGRSLQVHKESEGVTELRVDITLTREHDFLEIAPLEATQAFQMIVTLEAHAASADDSNDKHFSGMVKIKAAFATFVDEKASEDELNENGHAIARYIYPVARMELFRLLCGAKIKEVPVPWDMGSEPPSVQDP
jgi:hypothetical protein